MNIDNKELAMWIKDNVEFDQLILEFYKKGDPNSGWVHVSYNGDNNRKQFLVATREDEKVIYRPA
jgi:hypothetical protein